MWFTKLMGFSEQSPKQVRANLSLADGQITSTVNGATVGCGWLETPSLAELRALDREQPLQPRTRVSEVVGDVVALHMDPANAGALFQAASQFNLLEMVGPNVTPEAGVDRYSNDKTQGPACAIACGGGTIYRNYFAPVDGGLGQTADRQIDCLADIRRTLGEGLWQMRNGYALASHAGLQSINQRLEAASEAELDALRGLLRIGVQHGVEVVGTGRLVTQVYGSALPVAYGEPPASLWGPFAQLVLEASYEATLRVARIWQTSPVFLTALGGGVFGNKRDWIEAAILRAVGTVPGLDVRMVSYGRPSESAARICAAVDGRSADPRPSSRRGEARTSATHPIRVALIAPPHGPSVGVTFAPGKVQPNAMSGVWSRSLEADLDHLARHYNVDDLVCLVEDHELSSLQIETLPQRAEAHGISFHRLPIVDGSVPDEASLNALMAQVARWREAGRLVVFHCKGGLGRAGTLAACALIQAGMKPMAATAAVRLARPNAIETRAQERLIAGRTVGR